MSRPGIGTGNKMILCGRCRWGGTGATLRTYMGKRVAGFKSGLVFVSLGGPFLWVKVLSHKKNTCF